MRELYYTGLMSRLGEMHIEKEELEVLHFEMD